MYLGSEIGDGHYIWIAYSAAYNEWVKWKMLRLELRWQFHHVPPRLLMDRVSISLSYFKVVGPLLQAQRSVGTSEVVRWLPYGVVIATSHMGDLTVLSLGGLWTWKSECCISLGGLNLKQFQWIQMTVTASGRLFIVYVYLYTYNLYISIYIIIYICIYIIYIYIHM